MLHLIYLKFRNIFLQNSGIFMLFFPEFWSYGGNAKYLTLYPLKGRIRDKRVSKICQNLAEMLKMSEI